MHRMGDDDHKYAPLLGDYENGSVVPRFCLNKTPLERKLILLCTILALTTFCLIIAVAVLDHKYHEAEQHTSTVAPATTTTPTTPIPTTTTTTTPSNTTSQPTSTTQQTTSSATTSATTTISTTATTPTTTNATTPIPTTTKPTSPTNATTATPTPTTSATTPPPTTTANSTTHKSEVDISSEATPASTESIHSTDISTGTIPDSSTLKSRLRRNPTDLPYKSKGTTFDVSKWIVVVIAFICMCQ